MPCLVGCLAMFFPRLAIFIVWLASDYLQTAYQTVLWPVLGFILMPMTTLAYAFAWHNGGGSPTGSTLGAIVLVLGVLYDLGVIGGSASNQRARKAMMGGK